MGFFLLLICYCIFLLLGSLGISTFHVDLFGMLMLCHLLSCIIRPGLELEAEEIDLRKVAEIFPKGTPIYGAYLFELCEIVDHYFPPIIAQICCMEARALR